MSIPLLEVKPSSQNQRVEGYEVPSEDTPIGYRFTTTSSTSDIDEIIWAGYRQIFSEHLIIESYRQPFLESQLRNQAITVRDFIRGLGKSDVYRELVGETNSNYRLVDISFKRFLGRATYNQKEQIAWSIVIATKGLNGFIDAIVDSEEYRENFGNDIVPYQRRRYKGRPFNLVNPRYNSDWRDRESIRTSQGSGFYRARKTGDVTKEVVRQAIPSNFMAMAGSILTPEVNYQRSRDRVLSQISTMEIPDTTRKDTLPQTTIKPTKVALPYDYIPSDPRN
ncbi:phycobilisome rod-core linker polypeptide CpcG1 [cyanobacterium TDX16]|nr:phycobilisome rod-core linker polypeptide CpcG1 [cyanobacterium TDX16]